MVMWSNCLLNIPVWIQKFVLLPTWSEKLLIAVENAWLFKVMKWSDHKGSVTGETSKSTLPQLRNIKEKGKCCSLDFDLAVVHMNSQQLCLPSQDTVKIKLTKFRHRLGGSWGFTLTEELLAVGGCWEKEGHFSLGVWSVVSSRFPIPQGITPNLDASGQR